MLVLREKKCSMFQKYSQNTGKEVKRQFKKNKTCSNRKIQTVINSTNPLYKYRGPTKSKVLFKSHGVDLDSDLRSFLSLIRSLNESGRIFMIF